MRALLLAGAIAFAPAAAGAVQIAAFGQTSGVNTLSATVNGADTQTTLTVTNAIVDLTQFLSGPLSGLDFDLSATSVDAAQSVASAVIQHFSGTFCITTAINCGGTNVLSGDFVDAAFGAIGGVGLVVNVNNPPDQLTLTSDLLSASQLTAPNTLDLSLSNLVPKLAILGETIAPFSASFAGTVSASATPAPEPASLALLGCGLVGLSAIRRRSR